MFNSFQVCKVCVDENWTPNAKSSSTNVVPTNIELFQIVTIPPEAPREGIYANLSNHLGHNVRKACSSNEGIFDSCKQMMEQLLSRIAFDRARCFLGELSPRIFQHKTFQLRKSTIEIQRGGGQAQDQTWLSGGPVSSRRSSDSASSASGIAHSCVPMACMVLMAVGEIGRASCRERV